MFAFAEFFASLTRGVKAALPYFTSAAATDKGVNEIIKNARDAGFSFREQQARDIIGVLRNNIENSQTQLRSARVTGRDTPLNPVHYGVTIGKPLRNFSYKVARTIRGLTTGQFDNGFVTVSSNDALSVNQILDTASQYSEGPCNPTLEPIEVLSLEVVEANRSPFYEV